MSSSWIADRTGAIDSSGIRKVFDLAATLKDPVNLSIGQPDYDVPQEVKQACIDAINGGKNGYALTGGITELRDKLQGRMDAQYGHSDRTTFVSSGTSGSLVLAMLSLVNAGDEVIIFDPYFVMYKPLIELVGGVAGVIDTYPDFQIDVAKVAAAITPKTKMILTNSPSNPTGAVMDEATCKAIAELAAERNVALLSDEIYSCFCFDDEFVSPAKFNDQTIVIDGFSKSHAMTGWRVGFTHGPSEIINTMVKLQQYSFVCSPQPAQWASIAALEVETTVYSDSYKQKRDRLVNGLSDNFEIAKPGGAFYVYPKAPFGTGGDFVTRCIENNLLVIPGNIFSEKDTHFRISFAATDETIDRGIEILNQLAASGK
jgi:aspartate aminotransferase/aminotransferase